MRPLDISQIAGARVLRPFTSAPIAALLGLEGTRIPLNTELTQEHLKTMSIANRNAIIENRYVMVWPFASGAQIVANGAQSIPPATGDQPDGTKRHIVSRGFGKFDVIEGVIVSEGITKDEAQKVADAFVARPKTDAPKASKPKRDRKKKDRGADAAK